MKDLEVNINFTNAYNVMRIKGRITTYHDKNAHDSVVNYQRDEKLKLLIKTNAQDAPSRSYSEQLMYEKIHAEFLNRGDTDSYTYNVRDYVKNSYVNHTTNLM